MSLRNIAAKYGPRIAAVSGSLLAAGAALAEDPATALAALQAQSTASTGFGPALWGLAATTVGILVGVKWIKRGRGAA